MKILRLVCAFVVLTAACSACQLKEEPGSAAQQGDGPPPIPAPPDVAAPPADAVKTSSGLASKILFAGLGRAHPTLNNKVTVHYTGWTTDGKMFETTFYRDGPATFEVGRVVPGWIEALQLMVKGEKRRVWIPGDLAYDKSDLPNKPKGMLVFDIELLDIR